MLWRVHVELADRPGSLGTLASAVGSAGCNIISLHVVGEPADDGSITDELLVRVPDTADATTLATAIEAAGIRCTVLVRADATELSDPATTALALARMVIADPGSAPRAAATMLRARLVDPDAPAPDGSVHTLRVGASHLRLGRAWPFTATELSRAAALLELAAQLDIRVPPGAGRGDGATLQLHEGSQVRLRLAEPTDAPLVAALHARCSPATRRSRFLSPTPHLGPGELEGLVGTTESPAVLALTSDGGSAAGVANLIAHATEPGRVELALLVEDAWQRRGLGTALARHATELAVQRGVQELAAIARPDDLGVTALLRRAGLRPSAELGDGQVRLHVALPRRHDALIG